MYAVIGHLPAAKVPEPMPVVMHQVAMERLQGGWPKPQIVVQLFWRCLWLMQTDTVSSAVKLDADGGQLPQVASGNLFGLGARIAGGLLQSHA